MPPRKSKVPQARFTIYIPQEWDQKLDEIVKEKTEKEGGAIEWTKAALARAAIKEYLERYEEEKKRGE